MRSTTGGNEMYRYYSIMRPCGPWTFPQKDGRETVVNFDGKIYCEEIGRVAWGYIEYPEPLTEQEVKNYELVPDGQKIWYCVTSSFDDKGRVIAAITSTCEAAVQPEGGFTRTKRKDIYHDWYGSVEEANRAVEAAREV